MTSYVLAAALAVIAIACGWLLDRWLVRAPWTSRFPGTALLLWHSCAVTFIGSLAAAPILLAHDVLEQSLLWLTQAEKSALHLAYAGDREINPLWNVGALVVPLGLAAWAVIWALQRTAAEHRRLPHRQLRGQHLAARGHTDVVVVPDPRRLAYCLPRRPGRGRAPDLRRAKIVVSEAAWRALSRDELDAAVAHELAHLRRRHHSTVMFAQAVTATFGWTRALESYVDQVRRLVELEADDDAATTHGARTVARALLALSGPQPGRTAALPMGSGQVGERVRRLLRPARRGGALALVGGAAVAAGLTMLPLTVVLLPALAVLTGN